MTEIVERKTLRIGAAQFDAATGNIAANAAAHERLIDEAGGIGVHVLVFPELSLTGYASSILDETPERCVIDLDGPDLSPVRESSGKTSTCTPIPPARRRRCNIRFAARTARYLRCEQDEMTEIVERKTLRIGAAQFDAATGNIAANAAAHERLIDEAGGIGGDVPDDELVSPRYGHDPSLPFSFGVALGAWRLALAQASRNPHPSSRADWWIHSYAGDNQRFSCGQPVAAVAIFDLPQGLHAT